MVRSRGHATAKGVLEEQRMSSERGKRTRSAEDDDRQEGAPSSSRRVPSPGRSDSVDFLRAKVLYAKAVLPEDTKSGISNRLEDRGWVYSNPGFVFCVVHKQLIRRTDVDYEDSEESCRVCPLETSPVNLPPLSIEMAKGDMSDDLFSVRKARAVYMSYRDKFDTLLNDFQQKNSVNERDGKDAGEEASRLRRYISAAFIKYEEACWDVSVRMRDLAATEQRVPAPLLKEMVDFVATVTSDPVRMRIGGAEAFKEGPRTFCHEHRAVGDAVMMMQPLHYLRCGICPCESDASYVDGAGSSSHRPLKKNTEFGLER
jgi:hypothetical protein